MISRTSLHKPLPTLPGWCIGVLVVIWGLTCLAVAPLKHVLVERPRAESVSVVLDGEADKLQRKLNRKLAKMLAQVDEVAAAPNTLRVLNSPRDEQSQWQKKARTLDSRSPRSSWFFRAKLVLPDAQRIYLLNPEFDTFPLAGNFVAELLYEAALAGEDTSPRAAKTDQWHIYIARPVVRDGEVEGVVLVEFIPATLEDAIRPSEVNSGRVNLIQAVERLPDVNFYSRGTGWRDEYAVSRDTLVDAWTLKFTGSAQLVRSVAPDPTLFQLSVAALAILSLLLSYALVRRNIVIPGTARRASVDPRDDLFTEKFVRGSVDLSLSAARGNGGGERPRTKQTMENLPAHVFRDYDIRGKAGSELNSDFARALGRVLGTMALDGGETHLLVCADGRISSPTLKTALIAGITSTGCHVINMGEAPTPVMNFALSTIDTTSSGVMVTASHNPREDNGFKIILNNRVLSSDEITGLRYRMSAGKVAKGEGHVSQADYNQKYINYIVGETLPPVGIKVAIDCGNGISSVIAPTLFGRLGCRLTELFTDVDGNFPNHPPDPTCSENLQALVDRVRDQKLDLGLAFDGDGDRLVAVTGSGRIVWPDELLMIFARDVATRHPGAQIIYDVKSTRRLHDLVTSYGGEPVMWKTGHAHMRNKVWETHALLGGEYSGHIFFNDQWFGFDDGIYTAARLLEVIATREQSLDAIVDSFPPVFSTEEIKVPIDEERKAPFLREFIDRSNFGDGERVTIDGLRVEYGHGWGLIRASNTSAALTLRFEADTDAALNDIMDTFRSQLQKLDPSLPLDF